MVDPLERYKKRCVDCTPMTSFTNDNRGSGWWFNNRPTLNQAMPNYIGGSGSRATFSKIESIQLKDVRKDTGSGGYRNCMFFSYNKPGIGTRSFSGQAPLSSNGIGANDHAIADKLYLNPSSTSTNPGCPNGFSAFTVRHQMCYTGR